MKRLKDRNFPRFSERSIRNLVGSEGELQEASERLGHASPATMKRYYRLKPTVVVPLSSQIKLKKLLKVVVKLSETLISIGNSRSRLYPYIYRSEVRFRVRGYEPRGREFESLRARHKNKDLEKF